MIYCLFNIILSILTFQAFKNKNQGAYMTTDHIKETLSFQNKDYIVHNIQLLEKKGLAKNQFPSFCRPGAD